MSELVSIIKERRSANKFLPEIELLNHELDEIFEWVKYAPSAFNLQHAHYVVVQDPERKQQMYQASGKQYKVQTASAVIIVLGHMDAHHHAPQINEGLLHLGILNQREYEEQVQSVQQFYEERGEAFKRDEAIRNASLSAMTFMLAAKDKGWDTCPMIGFDPAAVQHMLDIPERYIPAMMITIGKEDTGSQRIRGYRKPVGEFVSYNHF
ncbi:nitroreductase family protein [Paenibacillus bovis]|uniref:NAD(P)H nitroreductase n=1 Tax=Paenibacillus bovis TaxID=1616788 RepID=A0A172ZEN8_9BACL|nr:nitroreductase family protein [Paenibacillus bovis]ANF96106.1 NAD(P)H nitroreductase [Paenibacillus bovis]